jgi:hypothetical protein
MTAAVRAPANDMTDRQWVAAYVIDNAPFMFEPIVEVKRFRDELAVKIARQLVDDIGVTDLDFFAEADKLATELERCDTVVDQHALLGQVARGEA